MACLLLFLFISEIMKDNEFVIQHINILNENKFVIRTHKWNAQITIFLGIVASIIRGNSPFKIIQKNLCQTMTAFVPSL